MAVIIWFATLAFAVYQILRDDAMRIIGMLTYRDVLIDANGCRRSRQAAESLYGVRVVDIAEIFEALSATKLPIRLSVPPRVFISYRWGTDDENAWVYNLASELRGRGYEILFDRFWQAPLEKDTVGELVSQIASCHIFLMIVDPGYIESVGTSEGAFLRRGWAYVEFRISEFMPVQHFRWGLLRAGDEVPRKCRLPNENSLGNVADVRTADKLKEVVSRLFPIVKGIPNQDNRQEAEALLTQAMKEGLEGELIKAKNLSTRAIDLIPDLKDGYRMFALFALLANDLKDAHWAVDNIMKTDQIGGPSSPVIRRTAYLLAAQLLNTMGQHRSALEVISHGTLDQLYHLILSNALANLGQERAAFAHIMRALQDLPESQERWKATHQSIHQIYAHPPSYDKHLLADLIRSLYPAYPILRITQFDFLSTNKTGQVVFPNVDFIAECELPEYQYNAFFNTTIFMKALEGIPIEVFSFKSSYSKEISGHKYEVRCSSCDHAISFSEEREILCHTCGAELIPPASIALHNYPGCPYCRSKVFTLLAPALDGGRCPCPYCRSGDFKCDSI